MGSIPGIRPARPLSVTGSVTPGPIVLIFALVLTLGAGWISVWLLLPAAVLWLVGLVSRHPVDFSVFATAFIAAWVASATGIYERATFVPQIVSYVSSGTTPWNLLINLNVWGPRYLVAYPVSWASRTYGLDLDIGWTYYMATVLVLEAFVVHRAWLAAQALVRPPGAGARLITGLVSSAAFLTLGIFMHGRLAPAHLGMAMIMLGLINWSRDGRPGWAGAFLILLGLFPLSLMSSGTVMPAAGVLIAGAVVATMSAWRERWRSLLLLPLFMAPAAPFILVGYFKNVTFFEQREGGLWLILNHGAGRVFQEGPLVVVAVLLYGAVAVGIVARIILSRRARLVLPGIPPIMLAIPISLVAGLFGYSAMTMAIPPLAILGLLGVSRLVESRERSQVVARG